MAGIRAIASRGLHRDITLPRRGERTTESAGNVARVAN